jgi:hypothetical protein
VEARLLRVTQSVRTAPPGGAARPSLSSSSSLLLLLLLLVLAVKQAGASDRQAFINTKLEGGG